MVRAARAMLRWEQKDLAERTMLSIASVKRLETLPGKLAAQGRTVMAIVSAFEDAGIRFIADIDNGNMRSSLGIYMVFKTNKDGSIRNVILDKEDIASIKSKTKKS